MLNFLQSEPTESEYVPNVPKYSDLTPKEFFLGIAKRLKTENESTRSKTNAQYIIQMCRRHRNMTPADKFGYWKNNVWAETAGFASLHAVPIFQQLIVGAESNFAQAEIRLDITAKSNKYKGVEKVAKDIYDALEPRQWTEISRQSAFYNAILMLNAFYISRLNKDGGENVSVPQFNDIKYEMGGMAICSECYSPTDLGSNTEQTCPQCGSDHLSIIDEPETRDDQVVAGFNQNKSGEPEMIMADGLDVSVDPNGSPADVKSCGWIEWRQQAQKEELKRLYPHLKLEGMPVWSYQTKLKKALKRYEGGEAGVSTESDKTEFELRTIWLDVTEYEGQIAPADLKIGEKVVIKRGDKLGEKWPKGLVLGLIDQEIAFIDTESKNKRIKSSLWISDGISFEGLGARAGLDVQRKINQLENVAMEGETRSLKGSLLYNPEVFDGHHLEGANTNIPSKQDFAQGERPLSNYAVPLQVEGLSPETLAYMASQKQTMQEIMGIPDVVLGQDTSTDKTFGGQALRSRNALGLLTPKTQSTARAKEGWIIDQLDIIQTYFSPEALRNFGLRYGAEWQDDEIRDFLEADLDEAITANYIPGTEVPESRFEKGMRLRADVAAGFIPLTPELKQKFARESNHDGIDVDNYDSNRKLAEKRFNFLKTTIEQGQLDEMFIRYEEAMIDPTTGMRAADQTGVPVPNPLAQQLLNAPDLTIYKFEEDGSQMVSFWSEKVRDIAGSTSTQSPMLLAMCSAMVQKHNQAIFEVGMTKGTQEGAVMAATQAPAAIGQQMLQKDAAEHAQSIQPPAPAPEAAPAEPHPADVAKGKIIESISYKDLSPTGKKQLGDHIGLNIPMAELKQQAKDAKPAPKVAAKPAAKKPAKKK